MELITNEELDIIYKQHIVQLRYRPEFSFDQKTQYDAVMKRPANTDFMNKCMEFRSI